MVKVMPKAIEKIKEILREEKKEGYGLRLALVGGGCAGFQYYLDFEKEATPDDIVFEQEDGIKVFVDKRLLQYLDNSTIDYEEGLTGAGFKIDNPNATGGCGCGKSFSFE
jgi:iron-sulfur cluster assembly accessory protein